MPARTADWPLLDYDTDPVPSDPSELDEIIRYYAQVSEALATQAALMRKLGDGDETLLKGLSADAMRKRAHDSASLLGKAGTRYEQMHQALSTYRPDLEVARSETMAAVTEAADASAGQRSAENMPDPVAQLRAEDAPPLTPADEMQSEGRSRAIAEAGDRLAASKARARRAMAAFDTAAERTAAAIRMGWSLDGLHTSGWDAFVHGLNKILKKIVEVLGYIGMALAVIGLVVSGVGIIALVGLGIAVVSLAINIILAAQGEASWLGVILGVVAILTVGVGTVVTRSVQKVQALTVGRANQVIQRQVPQAVTQLRAIENAKRAANAPLHISRPLANVPRPVPNFSRPLPNVSRPVPNFSRPLPNVSRPVPNISRPLPLNAVPSTAAVTGKITALEKIAAGTKANALEPNWWQVTNPAYLATNAKKFTEFSWAWDKAVGVDAPRKINDLLRSTNAVTRPGMPLPTGMLSPTWMYFGGPAFTWGWMTGVFGAVINASNFGADPRAKWPWGDATYAGLTGNRPL